MRALHGRTDGLPLFVADVVSDLIAQGESAIDGEPSARLRLASVAIPENLAGIIEQYMQRLTPAERALLEVASVCGMEFRLATVAEVLQGDVAALGASCVELVRRQRWLTHAPLERMNAASDVLYTFRHALYREVLYNQIGPVTRAELHRKVAAALERERANGANVTAAELASHLEPVTSTSPQSLLRRCRGIGSVAVQPRSDDGPHRTCTGASPTGRRER